MSYTFTKSLEVDTDDNGTNCKVRVNEITNGSNSCFGTINSKYYYQQRSSNSAITVTINEGVTLREGDIICIHSLTTGSTLSDIRKHDVYPADSKNGTPLVTAQKTDTNWEDLTVEITENFATAANINKALYLVRNGNGLRVHSITITRPSGGPINPTRNFTNFKINFTGESTIDQNTTYYVTSTDADGKATYTSEERSSYLATFKGRYHNTTYGITGNPVITIPVDGPVKIYYGTNDFGADVTVKDGNGNTVGSMNTNGGKWNASKPDENLASVIYNSETSTVLTLTGGGYIPFMKAEACDYIPTVTVTYYDTNGNKIGEETVNGSSALAYKYGESDVTVPSGSKFRGWFDKATNGEKIAEGKVLNANLSLYAVATPVETPTKGSTFTYDLTRDYFYQEDHEGIEMTGGYHNNHGWTFASGQTIKVPVAGNATVTIGLCNSSNDNSVNVSSESGVGTITPSSFSAKGASDNQPKEVKYEGPATTLTFTFTNRAYIHSVKVENDALPASDLAIVSGKNIINLTPGGTYQLTKGTDYTTNSTGALTYSSSNSSVALVSATGQITAGSGYGQAIITVTQTATDDRLGASIEFTVKVVSASGQTGKPTATVGDDGKVYLLNNNLDPDAAIYYTTDGSEPTDQSTRYNGVITGLENKVVKAVAYSSGKSASDVITVYVKVPVTLTWDWNSTKAFSLTPRYSSEELKSLFDENTRANIGSNLEYKGRSNTVKGKDYTFEKFQLSASLKKGDKNTAIQFNVLTKAGIYFRPTASSSTISRGGTNTSKNVDISVANETKEQYLAEWLTPNRYDGSGTSTDGGATGYCTYSFGENAFSEIAMSSDVSIYIYTYNVAKDYYYADMSIEGYISGSEYDGEFYNVGYNVEPEEGGIVVQKPSIASVMAGKIVTFEATPNVGYKFVNWTKTSDNSVLSTDAKYIRTITEDTYVTANFQKLPLVTFTKENLQFTVEGNVPQEQYVDANTYKLHIPTNYELYRDGYTMIGWTDGVNTYDLNEDYRFDKDIILRPKFVKNDIAITDANSKVTVRWDLNHRDRPANSPQINVYTNDEQTEKSTGIYTRTAMVNGIALDMKMGIKAPGANTKLDNRDGTVPVSAAQVNHGTQVTLPAVPGMKVTLKASEGKDERTISDRTSPRHTKFVEGTTIPSYFGVDTNANPTRVNDNTAEYVYNGEAKTVTLTFQQITGQGDWGFYEWIEVEYPVLPNVTFVNSITDKLDREKLENTGSVSVTAKIPEHTNTGSRYLAGDVVTISAEAKYGYTITGFTCAAGSSQLSDQNITDGGKKATVKYTVVNGDNIVTAIYARQTTYAVRVITADKNLGDVTLKPLYENFMVKGTDYVEGYYTKDTNVQLVSEAGEGNVLQYWMDGANTWTGGNAKTGTTVDITVGEAPTSYTAYFKLGEVGTVIFDLTDSGVDMDAATFSGSTSMTPAQLSGVRSFNVPTNFTFYKDGYTLKHWKVKNTETIYTLGQRGSFTTANQEITLVPVFDTNITTQENRQNNPVIRYDFGSGIFEYTDTDPAVPAEQRSRKVSAQRVNIGSDVKTFWTSKVYVNALVGGESNPHWRDVAMWVNTGSKGFIRNGDLPEWAAFGPGTTFEVASGSGTKFSLMTYAPITTTTIDGVVPTLEEARSNPAKHEYVYTYTTRNTDERVKIVIGDDYSYYKWLEAATLAANMVDLHIKTTDNVVGEIKTVASSDETNNPSKDLDDGGRSFQKGSKVVVTFYRKFGAEFSKIVDKDNNDFAVLEMISDNKIRMIKSDGITMEELPRNADGTWGGGTDHVFKLSVSEPTADDPIDADKAKGYRTKYVLEFDITTHRNLEIQFKEKATYYVNFNTGKEAIGVAPTAKWLEAGDSYTIGNNQTLYYEGHTLDHWVDLSNNTYNIGGSYQMSATNPSDMLLYPVFRQNTFSLLDLPADATATWSFARSAGAPIISYQRINGIYIAQVSNGTSEIDVKLDLVGESGKIDNKASEDRAQINGGSIFRFPVTYGCEIGLNGFSPSYQIETTKICGNTGYPKGQNVAYIYNGNAGTGDVAFADDGKYYTQFSVTYKAQQEAAMPTLTSVRYGSTSVDVSTLTTNGVVSVTIDPDVVNNTVPTVSAEVTNGTVEIEQATYDNPVATLTLKTSGGMPVKSYAINFNFNTPATAPTFIKYIVNGVEYTNGREIHVNDAPVSGTITLVFDRIMAAVSVVSPVYEVTYSAKQGKELVFHYWNLPVNTVSNLIFPANTFKDVYGKELDGDQVAVYLKCASTTMPVEHKTFDYVVGHGDVPNINDIIKAVNNTGGQERVRIFIPDGEYELTGNEISSWKAGDETTDDEGNSKPIPAGGFQYNNHMTAIHRSNVSLIGQSQDKTILYNRPKYEGIGATATIHVVGTDDYLEDLTLENRYPYYKANFAGRAVAFWDQGNRQVLKNVSLMSYQDTYYSHGNGNYRGYFEDCTLAGTVDWLCGNGDIWLERCGLMVRNRSGNNIAAPYTTTSWGYVFSNCRIYPEEGANLVTDKSYTLGRPWGGTPGATYLHTTFDVMPRDEGWQAMQNSYVLKFHEYGSKDTYGHPISLGTRTLAGAAPLKGSDDIILTSAEAANYTIENVLGGDDAFDPRVFTMQIDATDADTAEKDAKNSLVWDANLHTDDDRLVWNVHNMALCYFIFKKDEVTGKWKYVTNVAQTEQGSTMSTSVEQYGTGDYCLRAANQRGGLGAATAPIKFTVSSKYTLEIKQVGETPGYGWSTLCLPYNANKPTQNTDGVDVTNTLKIYSGECKSGQTSINDYEMVLKPVEVLSAEKGYVVCGPVGKYVFSSTSHPASDTGNILKGNSSDNDIPTGNNNCYVLANKTYGLGFYKYTGATLAAHRAWLPVGKVSSSVTSNSAKAIKFVFQDEFGNTTAIGEITADGRYEFHKAEIYDLNGIRVQTPVRGRVYIINGEKRQWK